MKEQTATRGQVTCAVIKSLEIMANRLRRHSLISTSKARSGHPTSSLSCAHLISTLFFHFLRFDIKHPDNPLNDRFILSKGHASPILWAAWAEAGAFPLEKLLTLRNSDSDLEGHPTPRNPWVDVATGSLGQGLSAGIGMALASKMNQVENHIFVLMGDGEVAEGAVWEAAELASHYRLKNLVAVLDVNRLGQSQATMHGHDLLTHEQRFRSLGWQTLVIDGHNIEEIIGAFDRATSANTQPSVIIARTVKGKGVSFLEDKEGWHGKPVPPGKDLARALAEIGDDLELEQPLHISSPLGDATQIVKAVPHCEMAPPKYKAGEVVATREAYGHALTKLGTCDPTVVALDGDTKNSTYSEYFLKAYPDRFVECFIAEQNMVGIAIGLSSLGKIPFASTFASFMTRAYDLIRMASISQVNLKLCGSHAGISIGEDGPSQMGLEDLAIMRAIQGSTIFYPSDAVSAERLVELAAHTPRIVYIRTSRPKTALLYPNDETFEVGGSKVLRSSQDDCATVVAAGITLHEALKTYEDLEKDGLKVRIIDLYSIKPLDIHTLQKAAHETGVIITVEDHYPEGGLGDAVISALANENCKFRKLAVNGLPRSGKPAELMDMFGISSRNITKAVRELTADR